MEDPRMGMLRLTGKLREKESAREVLVVLHGLAGTCDSYYSQRAAVAAEQAGLACMRMNFRGADGETGDFYHAGLTSDVSAALESPDLKSYDRIYLLGYSIGGHIALKYGVDYRNERLRGIAAICSPLDLAECSRIIDSPRSWFYRQYLLIGLKKLYTKLAKNHHLRVPVSRAMKISSMHEWDETIVAPRHGFDGAADYYRKTSVGPLLDQMKHRALLVASRHDPMVPAEAILPWTGKADGHMETRWIERGGHVGFPETLDLGFDTERGVENQVISWLRESTP
ncbi:MAG: alpha/beta fold hydrolase [Acidobacteriota bacterium]